MSERRPTPLDWMNPGDGAILEALREDGPEILPLLASSRGLHLKYVERRCHELEGRGLIARVDGSAYRITERGERYLDGEFPAPGGERSPARTVEGD